MAAELNNDFLKDNCYMPLCNADNDSYMNDFSSDFYDTSCNENICFDDSSCSSGRPGKNVLHKDILNRLSNMYPDIYSAINADTFGNCTQSYVTLSKHVSETKGLTLGHLNVRSLLPKMNEIQFLVHISNFDVFCVNESWLDDSIGSFYQKR